ncbi:allophanate hydrolase subunit 1 [Rhodobacteraceae bacterium M382]|nr:allophanate hydrolase subunit 1 [Rhodobacteraceae bacterium M382]
MPVHFAQTEGFPMIRTVGVQGMLVTFADQMTEASNRATLAFRTAIEQLDLEGVIETSTSLASAYVRFDPQSLSHARLHDCLSTLLDARDWYAAELPVGRRFWRVPTVYGTSRAPQLAEAADLAGMSEHQAIESLSSSRVRVLTIGFAPGQPYLGPLGKEWNIPRQTELTPLVPAGALVLAISQFVLFSSSTPTGWRHVGQTGIGIFQPKAATPFALRAGDELQFDAVTEQEFGRICERDPSFGGATATEIRA